MKALLAAALLTMVGFAGCLEELGLKEVDQLDLPEARQNAYIFDGVYHFRCPEVTNGTRGLALVQPECGDSAVPRAVEQILYLGGAEPNVAVIGHETDNTTLLITTFDQVQRSRDYGRTWEVAHDFVIPDFPTTVDRFGTADPMLWYDEDAQRVFVDHMHPALLCTYLAYSDDEGSSWSDEQLPIAPGLMSCATPFIDHQKVMTSKPGPAQGTIPLPPESVTGYANVLYMCYNKIDPFLTGYALGTWCAVSFDSGRMWAYDNKVYPEDNTCGGINGHPAADPDGRVYVPKGAFAAGAGCPRAPQVAVTEDNGQTWTIRTYPGTFHQTEIDPDLTFTPDGTGYLLVRGGDQRSWLFRSPDQFQTWEGPFEISPPDLQLTVFAGITSGDDGRIAMAYLGTRDEQLLYGQPVFGVEPSNVTGGTEWHLFVTTSWDAAAGQPTFTTTQVTPSEDPVQVGCVWLRGGIGGPKLCRNLLDFIDMGRDDDGRYVVGFTDGCTPRRGCTTDVNSANFQSRDSEVAVAVLDSGLGLFSEKGQVPPLGLLPPQPIPRNEG